MKIVAIAVKGKEFLYDASTAHKVPQTKAQHYADLLNGAGYQTSEDRLWWVYDIDRYDKAYIYALMQEFYTYRGSLKEKCYNGF